MADGTQRESDRRPGQRSESVATERVRIDKWLWAARFFKTRSIAANAIAGGKVSLNGDRTKRSKLVKVGDVLQVRKGLFEYTVTIQDLAEKRGPAAKAQTLYEESEESKQAREALAEQLAIERAEAPPPIPRLSKGRPTKRDRRQIDRFKSDV